MPHEEQPCQPIRGAECCSTEWAGARWLVESRFAVALPGAGISTESGIPDFRSPGGIWSKSQPVMFEDFLADGEARHEYWRQKCRARFLPEPLVAQFLQTDTVPECPQCGGLLKHATVSFGQALPAEVLQQAVEMSRRSDLFLAIGSSLVVEPAARGAPAGPSQRCQAGNHQSRRHRPGPNGRRSAARGDRRDAGGDRPGGGRPSRRRLTG